MSTQISNSEDALRFTAAFERVELADEIGPQLKCEEVDALAGLLRALGEPAAAKTWISSYASADDHADGRHQGDCDPYLVPVDPMEYLGCDSCQ